MELIAFRVRMYKGIIDSGWVDVNDLTVLVGKNESGKTSLLKALHKLNPAASEPYDIEQEWPRTHRSEQSVKHKVCEARFRLSDRQKATLAKRFSIEDFPDTVIISRDYDRALEVEVEEEIFSDRPYLVDVDKFLDSLPRIPSGVSTRFRQRANRCLREATDSASQEDYAKLAGMIEAREEYLRSALSPSEPIQEIEIGFINQYRLSIQNLIHELERLSTAQIRGSEYIIKHLPTFIYMDDYRVFNGTAQLNEIQNHRDENSLTEADQTFLTILELSELDLDELVRLGEGDGEKVTQRYYKLDSGTDTLTKVFSNHLRQRNYEVEYQADGSYFLTFVKDDVDSTPIKLEERSKGFQWFFSFDLMFMHGTKKTFKGSVVLLDEPGLHLHPEAQKDLLLRFEEYAKENTFLYTTHLPYMIDLKHPDRIRVLKEPKKGIKESKKGITVTTDLVESSPEARFVLQAALGMDASHSLLVADRNLVVEGVHDYYILAGLSNWLKRIGEQGLPEDIRITPGTSASESVHVATLMIGQNLDVVVLFDSDDEGREARDKLVKKWLTQYKETRTEVVMLGGAVGVDCDFELEDLFSDDFMKDVVEETYSKELADAGVDDILLQDEGMIWDRIESFMKEHKINKINKGSIAKRVRDRLSKMENASELPPETKENAIKLFQTIHKAFGEAESKSD